MYWARNSAEGAFVTSDGTYYGPLSGDRETEWGEFKEGFAEFFSAVVRGYDQAAVHRDVEAPYDAVDPNAGPHRVIRTLWDVYDDDDTPLSDVWYEGTVDDPVVVPRWVGAYGAGDDDRLSHSGSPPSGAALAKVWTVFDEHWPIGMGDVRRALKDRYTKATFNQRGFDAALYANGLLRDDISENLYRPADVHVTGQQKADGAFRGTVRVWSEVTDPDVFSDDADQAHVKVRLEYKYTSPSGRVTWIPVASTATKASSAPPGETDDGRWYAIDWDTTQPSPVAFTPSHRGGWVKNTDALLSDLSGVRKDDVGLRLNACDDLTETEPVAVTLPGGALPDIDNVDPVHLESSDTLCTAADDQLRPAVTRDRAVWLDYRGTPGIIYAHQWLAPVGESPLQTGWLCGFPDVSDDFAVWDSGHAGGPVHIWAADMRSHTPASFTYFRVSDGPAGEYDASVDGTTVVWVDYRSGLSDIYGATVDLDAHTATEFPVCTDAAVQRGAQVSGNYVAWEDLRNDPGATPQSNSDVYGYDLSRHTEFPVSTSARNQGYVRICGDLVAWTEYDMVSTPDVTYADNGDVWAMDLSTRTRFPVATDPHVNEFLLNLEGDVVMYSAVGKDGVIWDDGIWARELTTNDVFPVVTGSGADWADVHGRRVVWNPWNGSDYDIAVGTLSPLPTWSTGLVLQAGAASASGGSVVAGTYGRSLAGATTEMRFKIGAGAWSAWEPYAAAKTLALPTGTVTVQAEYRDAGGGTSPAVQDSIVVQ